MSVRVLTPADAAELRGLRLRALADDPDPFLSTLEEESLRPLKVTEDRLRAMEGAAVDAVLGAYEGGVLVGMLGISREDRRKASHRATVWGVFIAKEARGHGLGKALLAVALERARSEGVEQVQLTVTSTAHAARALYAKAGFVLAGTLVGAMKDGDRYIDEEVLVCFLKECRPVSPSLRS